MSEIGVYIERGPVDWQVLQRRLDNTARLILKGRWACGSGGYRVMVRVVREDSGLPAAAHLQWREVTTRRDGTWSARIEGIPAGGLYRLETALREGKGWTEDWAKRGDTRHFLGVGDLWVVAGQSNSAGYGRGPCYDPPELGVHSLTNAMRWSLATQPLNHSTDTAHPVNRETSNPAHCPWLAWAKHMKRELGVPIGLLQASLGGSPLRRWNPAEPGLSDLYENMLNVIDRAGGAVAGVLWYQGESDAGNAQQARSYRKRFGDAVRAWRKALKSSRLPVLTVQINRHTQTKPEDIDEGWSVVREQQRQAARKIPNVAIVPMGDVPMSDQVHNSPHGNLLLAERASWAALAAFHGRDVHGRAGDLSQAVAIDGQTVELTFDNVAGRLQNHDASSQPFAVRDAQGDVPIESLQYTEGPRVRLLLARSLGRSGRVSCGLGCNPPALPIDNLTRMPILAFHDVKIAQPS